MYTSTGVFSDRLFDLLAREGEVDFTAVANVVGVICYGSLNSRLVMMLRMFGMPSMLILLSGLSLLFCLSLLCFHLSVFSRFLSLTSNIYF